MTRSPRLAANTATTRLFVALAECLGSEDPALRSWAQGYALNLSKGLATMALDSARATGKAKPRKARK